MRIILFAVLILIACTQSETPNPPETKQTQFKALYVNLLRFQERHSSGDAVPADSLLKIYRQHQFTSKSYNDILNWYNQNPERWKSFYKDVTAILEKTSTVSTVRIKTP